MLVTRYQYLYLACNSPNLKPFTSLLLAWQDHGVFSLNYHYLVDCCSTNENAIIHNANYVVHKTRI